jgi:DNA-binding winged helix-turn-helix (wHTH) protein
MSERDKTLVDSGVCFGPYRLDLAALRLWRGTQAVKLTGKTFAVLRYLVEHPGQLVTEEDLFQAVWAETVVSDATLASCIQELRQALRDDAKKPRYIETVHRRGYRFLAPITTAPPVVSRQLSVISREEQVRGQGAFLAPRPPYRTPRFVGREAELAHLHQWLEKALKGERQLVFVTGEPGIGKTTVVEAFLARLQAGRVGGAHPTRAHNAAPDL